MANSNPLYFKSIHWVQSTVSEMSYVLKYSNSPSYREKKKKNSYSIIDGTVFKFIAIYFALLKY